MVTKHGTKPSTLVGVASQCIELIRKVEAFANPEQLTIREEPRRFIFRARASLGSGSRQARRVFGQFRFLIRRTGYSERAQAWVLFHVGYGNVSSDSLGFGT